MADAESQERRDQRIVDLEGQVEHQASKADQYQSQLNALQSSFDRITRALGFNTAEELENLVLGDRIIWNRRNIEWNAKRLPILKEEMKAAKERVSDLESEGEARAKELKKREEEVEVLQKKLSSAHAERDTATADLTTARSALSSANKQCDNAFNEIAIVRNSHDSLRAKYVSLQVYMKEQRASRKTDINRLDKAEKMGGNALHHAATKILDRHPTDSDGAPLSPIAKGKGKETRVSSVTGISSSPIPTPTVFGMSSVPNTPIKPRRTAAAEAPLTTTASAFEPGPSTAALFSAADTSGVPPSSYTLTGQSPRAPLRRSPRKLTPQKRKRPTDENEDGDENGCVAPSSPRSDVSATQDETQAPPLQFTPTKRARRTDELPTSLPRPLNALVLSASRDLSSSTTPAGGDLRCYLSTYAARD
ncbi:hypothetical protein PENSPDRAFT_411955 [Peniophora sp. CONT]|nr:hypothetical protein PENSPDRAFT_411955 [Peniophora sp. CONT]